MVREEGWSSLGRGVGPNVFRAVLMNASQLASYVVTVSVSIGISLIVLGAVQVRFLQGGAPEEWLL